MKVTADIKLMELDGLTGFYNFYIKGFPEEGDTTKEQEKRARFIKHVEQRLEQIPESVLISWPTSELILVELGFGLPMVHLSLSDRLLTIASDNSISLFVQFCIDDIG